MMFFSVFIVSILNLSYTFIECSDLNTSSNTLCSFKKSLEECLCVYKKDSSSVFPVLYADCSRMGLKKIPALTNVEELDISYNSIEAVDPLQFNFASSKIRSLELSQNRLSFIHQDFLNDMPNLVKLDLSSNELVKFLNSVIFKGLHKLEVLSLRSNRLSTLPERIFESLPNLKELDLSYNYLGSLMSDTKNLFKSSLGLSYNITTLKLDGLGINSLSSSFFDGAKCLKYISLANNPLNRVPEVPYGLTYLDLSGTDLTAISFKDLPYPTLQILKLNRLNKLEDIQDLAFYNLNGIEELQLNDCKKLKQLNILAFGMIIDSKNVNWPLKRLHISRSSLRTISSDYLEVFKTMEYVDLQNNPWTCDCDILWLKKLNGTYFKNMNVRCASPNALINKKVMELTPKDLQSCFDSRTYYQMILIGILCFLVAFLGVLIVYLVYLGPFYHKNKSRNIGPQSPYSGHTLRASTNAERDQES